MKDIDRLRRDCTDVYKQVGLALVVRKAYHPEDLETGAVAHCPVCWEPAYKQPSNSNCTSCFGTGFSGGYRAPVFMWGRVIFESFSKPSSHGGHSMAGEMDAFSGATGSCAYQSGKPVIEPNDLVFVCRSYSVDEVPLAVGERFIVGSTIQYTTMRGSLHGVQDSTYSFADELVYQKFEVAKLPEQDIRYGLAFA